MGPDVHARHKVCLTCPSWLGRCQKGLNLSSLMGCPERKFPPVGNAGYARDVDLSVGVSSAVGCTNCAAGTLRPVDTKLTPAKVAVLFARAMVAWRVAGFAVVEPGRHTQRFSKCQVCPHYRYFICQRCVCVSYIKSKLAGQICPDVPPRWT